MTLHWWMHWFWVTAQIVVSLTSPTTESSVSTSSVPLQSSSPLFGMHQQTTRMQYETTETLARLQQSYRIAKAIGIQPTTSTTDESSVESLRQAVTTDSPPQQPRNLQWGRIGTTATPGFERMRSLPSLSDNKTSPTSENKTSSQAGRIPGKKEAKITWIHAFSKPPRLKTSSPMPVSSEAPTAEELTVMPLQEDPHRPGSSGNANNKPLDPNAIRREQLQLPPVNRSEDSLVGQETVEPQAVATAASILEAGLIDSTRLGRARGTFTSEFQRDQLSEQKKEETIKETATGANVTEIATITGSCLAIIILLSTLGSLGFIMYRRRYLNPPQTLNSDKCSNPDSSGYIDDSTIRDNSEEMYSLDNDSFLNSLEAMTIQNYWTDSVKHTKL